LALLKNTFSLLNRAHYCNDAVRWTLSDCGCCTVAYYISDVVFAVTSESASICDSALQDALFIHSSTVFASFQFNLLFLCLFCASTCSVPSGSFTITVVAVALWRSMLNSERPGATAAGFHCPLFRVTRQITQQRTVLLLLLQYNMSNLTSPVAQRSLRETGTMGTLASQAEIGV